MLNYSRSGGAVRTLVIQAALAPLLVVALGCGGNRISTPTPVTSVTPAPPAVVGTYTIAAGANVVAPGESLSVSWTASPSYCCDWVILSKVGDRNSVQAWARSTAGASSATFTLVAPAEIGQYEFRYLLEDQRDVARSSIVTVGAVAR